MGEVNYKSLIAPIVAVGALGVATITGHPVSSNVQTEIVDVATTFVGMGVTVWGIIVSHEKKKKETPAPTTVVQKVVEATPVVEQVIPVVEQAVNEVESNTMKG